MGTRVDYPALTFEVDIEDLGAEDEDFNEIIRVELPQKLIDELIKVMREKDVEASSNLIQSLEPEWADDEIRIYADYYWKFVDKGVNGLVQNQNSEYSFKFVHASKKQAMAMIEWAKFRGIIITKSKTNKTKNEKTDEETEKLLNSLEDKNNHIRAIFTVDRLTEGWDVLNLFDIVRLYQGQNAGGSTKKNS